jgi:hypothetical protein
MLIYREIVKLYISEAKVHIMNNLLLSVVKTLIAHKMNLSIEGIILIISGSLLPIFRPPSSLFHP